MNKIIRELVYNKYNGRCAYCGCKIDIDQEIWNKMKQNINYYL